MMVEVEAERTNVVLKSIKDALVEMLMKIQEMDEFTAEIQSKRRVTKNLNFPPFDANLGTDQIVILLQEKVKVGLIASGKIGDGVDSGLSEDEVGDVKVESASGDESKLTESKAIRKVEDSLEEDEQRRMKTPSETNFAIDEKPPPYPQVYSSLITGRSTGLVSASPGAGGGKNFYLELFTIY
jgi:hypothetical protein